MQQQCTTALKNAKKNLKKKIKKSDLNRKKSDLNQKKIWFFKIMIFFQPWLAGTRSTYPGGMEGWVDLVVGSVNDLGVVGE